MILGPALAWLLAAATNAEFPRGTPRYEVRETLTVAERAPRERAEIPAAVASLDRAQIERLPATNLAELLDTLPGIQVLFPAGFGGAPMVRARGFFGAGEAEYVQVRVDGVPLGDPESGIVDLRALRAADLERVETLRGPGSSLYGDTALGGVIDVVTRPPAAGERGRASLAYASFSTGEADASWRLDRARSRFAAIVSGARTRGFRRFGESREGQLEFRLDHDFGSDSGQLLFASGQRRRGESGPLSVAEASADRFGANPLFRDDREQRDWWRAAAGWNGERAGMPLRGRLQMRESRNEFLRTLLLAPGFGDPLVRSTLTRALGASLESPTAPLQMSGELGWGLDLGRDWLETSYRNPATGGAAGSSGTRIASVQARRDRAGIFAAPSWRLSPGLRLTTGLRWDSVRDRHDGVDTETATAWSPRLGLAARIGGDAERAPDRVLLTAFVHAAGAFKAPTLDQRFDPRPFPDFAGGTVSISNSRLAPQRARHLEAGLARATRGARFDVVAYRTEVEDEIDFDPLTFRYVNLGSNLHRGAELELALRPAAAVRPRLSYAWTSVEPARGANRGRQLKNIPRHLARAAVSVTLPAELTAEVRCAWLGGRYLDDANLFPLEDAAILDFRLARELRRLRVFLDVLNATGEEHSALGYVLTDFSGQTAPHVFPAPGLAWRLGASFGF